MLMLGQGNASGRLGNLRLLHVLRRVRPSLGLDADGLSEALMLLLRFLHFLDHPLMFFCLFIHEVLFYELERVFRVTRLHGLLKFEHLIANIVAHLRGFLLVLEFFTATKLKYSLALLVRALFLAAPFIVLGQLAEHDGFLAMVALYLEYLNELFEDM